MPEQLFERLSELRKRVRYVLWVHGLCLLIVVFFLTATLAGALDWLWHLDDSGVRLILGLTILGATGFVTWRFLWRPLSVRFSNVDLASRIEKQNPAFSDSLASTVQFLENGEDTQVGSPELQREVIRRTLDRLHEVNVSGVLDTRPVQRVAWWAVGTCVLVASLVGFNQVEAATAMNRLLFPFSTVPWPRDVELRFVTAELKPLAATSGGALTVVQGDTLELFVENQRGSLPNDLKLIYRKADGKVLSEPMRQTTLWDSDERPRDIGGASLHVTSGPLFFWAKGGDGETVPLQVDVVPPPRVEGLRVTVTPPEYTGLTERSLSEGVGNVEGFVGTSVTLEARSNKKLESALLHRRNRKPVELTVSADGATISGEFQLDKPGNTSWWIELRDRQGFSNPEAPRFEIRATADGAPTVTIEVPETDLLVTPIATVPFRVQVRDDLGIQSADLTYEFPEGARTDPAAADPNGLDVGDEELTLIKKPRAEEPASIGAVVAGGQMVLESIQLFDGDNRPEQLNPEYDFELAPFGWRPGTRIVFRAEATDWFDLKGETHIGRSNPRTLIVVTDQEKRAELADRQAALLLDLERSATTQRNARDWLSELQVQLEETGTLRDEDLDLLKRVELDQRQIDSRLTDETDGLETRARAIRRERTENAVEDAESDELLGTLIGELEFLRTEPLPEIERRLTEARKLSGSDTKQTRSEKQKLKHAVESVASNQDETLRTLEGLLNDLSQWRSERNLSGDLRSLTGEQQTLNEESAGTLSELIGKEGPLSDQESADLQKISARQRRIADQVEQFQGELKDAIASMGDDDPERKHGFEEALKELTEADVANDMRQAAGNLNPDRRQVGAAMDQQRQAVEELQKIQDLLDNREVTDSETLVKKLAAARQEIGTARQLQELLLQKLEEAQQIADPAEREQALERLRRQQEQLRQEVAETVRRLQRLASPSATSANRSTERMQQGEQALEAGNQDAAREQLEEALDDLEQAERELAADQQQAEENLAREQMEKLADGLKAFIERQDALIAETERLRREHEKLGKWSRPLLASRRNHANAQRALAEETEAQAEAVDAVEAIGLALRGAVRFMEQAAERIEDKDVSPETVTIQSLAKKRFADLLEALSSGDDEENPEQQPNEQEGGPQEAGPDGDVITLIAQLKVIRSLQVDLIDRVELIRSRSGDDGTEVSETDASELEAIAEEQETLADLIRELTSFFGEPDIAPDPDGDDPLTNPFEEASDGEENP